MDGNTSADEVSSTQKSLSSSHDPGWNDPPKWAFSPTQSSTGSTPTKRILNKRVAFPLSSASPVATAGTEQPPTGIPSKLPPLVESSRITSAPHAPLLAPTGLEESAPSKIVIDKEKALEECLGNLEAVIMKELESNGRTEEVKRRLETMKIMWKEDKLKEQIYEKVLEISKALKNNDIEAADKIHVSLMMDHAALCTTWISGIRHLILELRSKSSETNLEAAKEDFHPYLLPQSVKSDDNS